MKNPIDRIEEIAAKAGDKLRTSILDLRDEINTAITAVMEDAQDAAEKTEQGKRAVLSIPVSLKWDLDNTHVTLAVSVNVKRKIEVEIELDDPSQAKLPFGEDGAQPTISGAVRDIVQTVRDAGATVTVKRGDETTGEFFERVQKNREKIGGAE